MGMMYAATFTGVAVTAQQDFFELTAPSDAVVKIHEVRIGQSSDTDSEQLSILLKRHTSGSTSGSGGSAATPVALDTGYAACGSSAEVNNTTKVTGGTSYTLVADALNVLSGFTYLPTPEARPTLSPSERFTVELGTTPADSLTMNGTLIFEEIGG